MNDDNEHSIFDSIPAEAPESGAHAYEEGMTVPADEPVIRKEVADDGTLHMTVPLGDVDPFDHSAEEGAKRDHAKGLGVAPPEMPETAPEPLRNPAMMANATDPLQEEMERRFTQTYGEMKVEVTAQERDAFVRAALHDEELIWQIDLAGVGATIHVAIPPDEFTTSASAAVTRWGADGHIDKDSDLQWLLAFQQLHAWYQIRAIDGEPTKWSDYWVDGMPPLKAMRETMRDPVVVDPIALLNAARWRLILEATRIAELKYKICLQNWRDRSFFAGADTD